MQQIKRTRAVRCPVCGLSLIHIFHVRHHALEIRPVETGPGVSVIHIELDVGKAVLTGICFEDTPLVLDAVGLSVQTVVLAQTAV